MKLRVKVAVLSTVLRLELPDAEATVEGVQRAVAAELLRTLGFTLLSCRLSLNGRHPLAESASQRRLDQLDVVSGDTLHLLEPQFDPPVTQPVAHVEPPRQSLHVLPTATPPPPPPAAEQAEDAAPGESGEPLLVRDSGPGRLPRLVTWLAELAPPDGPHHLLMLVLHALMLEAGLEPVLPAADAQPTAGSLRPSVAPAPPEPTHADDAAATEEQPAEDTAAEEESVHSGRHWHLPAGWKRPGLFKVVYCLQGERALTAVLSVVPMGDVCVVHAVPAGGGQVFTVTLQPRQFVVATESEETADRLQNLRQLSNQFKSGITVPLVVHLQRSVGIVSPHEWRALPLELQLMILRRLSVRDLLRMRTTSRLARLRCDEPLLWRELVLRDFADSGEQLAALPPGHDWKRLYQQLYRRRRQSDGEAQAELPYPPAPRAPTEPWLGPPPLVAPPIAGIIGGEYDRLPSLGFQPPLALPRTRIDSMLPMGQRRFGF